MSVALNDIQAGQCYLTRNGQVARVVKILPDGRARYQFRSSTVAGAFGWYEATTDLRSFSHLIERGIPCARTPAMAESPLPLPVPQSDLTPLDGEGVPLGPENSRNNRPGTD